MKQEKIKKSVRDRYGKIAKKAGSCSLPSASCCGGEKCVKKIGKGIGYSTEDLESVPEGADLGLRLPWPLCTREKPWLIWVQAQASTVFWPQSRSERTGR